MQSPQRVWCELQQQCFSVPNGNHDAFALPDAIFVRDRKIDLIRRNYRRPKKSWDLFQDRPYKTFLEERVR